VLFRSVELGALVVCALAVGGVVAGLAFSQAGREEALPTTGPLAPITVSRPNVPVIGGGIPVDIDPMTHREDLSLLLAPLPGTHRYAMTVSNISNLGAIDAFQWYPPTGVRVLELIGSTRGHCNLTGLKGYGGNQFPTVVLYPNIFCTGLGLKAPSCTCLGDGGVVTISFVTDKDYGGGSGEIRMRAATLAFKPVPTYLAPGSTP